MKKLYSLIFTVTLYCMATFSAQASLIYRFDNSQHPNIDFVGVLAGNFHILFGPDILHSDDEFNILIGETAGGNELGQRLNITFELDWEGVGFGNTLNIVPTLDTFFVTFEILQGSFNVNSVSASFSNNGMHNIFDGTPIRATSQYIPVPSPPTISVFLCGLAVCVYLSKARANKNIELANN